MLMGYGLGKAWKSIKNRHKDAAAEAKLNEGIKDPQDKLSLVKDPQESLAKVTKGEYVDFRNNFGQFERDIVGESLTDTSLIEKAAGSTLGNYQLAADVQRRNMARYGGNITAAQRKQGAKSLYGGTVLGTTNAMNQAALKQRDINTERFYNLIDIGQGVFSGSQGMMGDAAKLAAERSAAAARASEARKAQRTGLALTAAAAAFFI